MGSLGFVWTYITFIINNRYPELDTPHSQEGMWTVVEATGDLGVEDRAYLYDRGLVVGAGQHIVNFVNFSLVVDFRTARLGLAPCLRSPPPLAARRHLSRLSGAPGGLW